MPDPLLLTDAQRAIVATLDGRGIRATWIDQQGAIRLAVKMATSLDAATCSVTFATPGTLAGFHVIGWRVGTLEELKIGRPVIWELCHATKDHAQLNRHRDYWSHTSFDWDGRPGPAPQEPAPPPPAAA